MLPSPRYPLIPVQAISVFADGFAIREQARPGLREHQIISGHHKQMGHLLWQQMRRVGLIDITVGNATCLGASQRSATRRCASHHIATQRLSRWGSPAARARLARMVPLKRLWHRDGHVKRNTCERRRKYLRYYGAPFSQQGRAVAANSTFR
jgi:hypothetical protein